MFAAVFDIISMLGRHDNWARDFFRAATYVFIGGVAVSGVRPLALQLPRPDRVVIAGAGILGANIAYQLAKRGAPVTVLDRATPAHGATANSFAWINAKKQPFPYFALNLLGDGLRDAVDPKLKNEA